MADQVVSETKSDEEAFEEVVSSFCLQRKRTTVVNRHLYDDIVLYLRLKQSGDKKAMRQRFDDVKRRSMRTLTRLYTLFTNHALGYVDRVVMRPHNNNSDIIDITESKFLVCVEDFCNTIRSCHVDNGCHCGQTKTWKLVDTRFCGVPKSLVIQFVRLCPACSVHSAKLEDSKINPIVITKCWSRLQVDLVEMDIVLRNDKQYRYVMHVRDHFSKFSVLNALCTKTADEVAYHLNQIFYTFGPCMVLQSDNGREFDNVVVKTLMKKWKVKIIHGQPRHPQSQGLVEQANSTVRARVGKCLLDSSMARNTWVDVLNDVQCK